MKTDYDFTEDVSVEIDDGDFIIRNSNNCIVYSKYPDEDAEYWREYDSNGNLIHSKNSNGYEIWYEIWYEYDKDNNEIYFKDSDGFEAWWEYDQNNDIIYYRDPEGYESWYNDEGDEITKEQFDSIHGKDYDLLY